MPMAMRAVPIHPTPPSGPAESTAVTPATMGMPQTLPAARLVEAENLQESQAPVGSEAATAARDVAEARESVVIDNGKKRKAEGDARPSPAVASALVGATGKRRASPEAEVRALHFSTNSRRTGNTSHHEPFAFGTRVTPPVKPWLAIVLNPDCPKVWASWVPEKE